MSIFNETRWYTNSSVTILSLLHICLCFLVPREICLIVKTFHKKVFNMASQNIRLHSTCISTVIYHQQQCARWYMRLARYGIGHFKLHIHSNIWQKSTDPQSSNIFFSFAGNHATKDHNVGFQRKTKYVLVLPILTGNVTNDKDHFVCDYRANCRRVFSVKMIHHQFRFPIVTCNLLIIDGGTTKNVNAILLRGPWWGPWSVSAEIWHTSCCIYAITTNLMSKDMSGNSWHKNDKMKSSNKWDWAIHFRNNETKYSNNEYSFCVING